MGDDHSAVGNGSQANDNPFAPRDALGKRVLRITAAQAAVVSAAAHLLWAWPRLSAPADARPYVFVLAAVVTVLVAAATLRAGEYRRLYALGAGTLLGLLAGYGVWHRSTALTALPTEPLAIVAAAAEIVGAAAFVALYRLAPPTAVVVARERDPEVEGETSTDID